MDLFQSSLNQSLRPLAEKLRPTQLSEVIGQEHILSSSKPLGKILRSGHLVNLIVTGPPGTGKTSFAAALAQTARARFVSLNAIDIGVKELKQVAEEGRRYLLEQNEKTLLFLDEIHRLNKNQQDVLLPHLERGDLYLVGATTEHPSYELNRALLSRCQVIQFKRLEPQSLMLLIKKIETFEKLQWPQLLTEASLQKLIQLANGDGRQFLNIFESILTLYKIQPDTFPMREEVLQELISTQVFAYDKSSDQHYDCVSALIKSIRGSDADAALYYMARMIVGGEDPVFIARRLIILASEDVGNAEPRALPLAIAGLQAVEAIGLPEAAINLAQVVTFLASAPKSNRSYKAWNRAREFVATTGSPDLPFYLKSSAKGNDQYKYPHDFEKAYVEQSYWPSSLEPQKFYEPSARGQEKLIQEYLKWLKQK